MGTNLPRKLNQKMQIVGEQIKPALHLTAKKANIVETRVTSTNDRYHILLSKRFDRRADGKRLHFASVMTLLGQMMVTMPIFFLCLISCKPSDGKKQVATDTSSVVSNIGEKGEKNYSDFFKKFASDSCFQKQHISFPLKVIFNGYDYEENDTVFHLSASDWQFINFSDSIIGEEKVLVEIDAKRYMIILKGYDTGVHIEYFFKKDKSTWLLYQITDSSN